MYNINGMANEDANCIITSHDILTHCPKFYWNLHAYWRSVLTRPSSANKDPRYIFIRTSDILTDSAWIPLKCNVVCLQIGIGYLIKIRVFIVLKWELWCTWASLSEPRNHSYWCHFEWALVRSSPSWCRCDSLLGGTNLWGAFWGVGPPRIKGITVLCLIHLMGRRHGGPPQRFVMPNPRNCSTKTRNSLEPLHYKPHRILRKIKSPHLLWLRRKRSSLLAKVWETWHARRVNAIWCQTFWVVLWKQSIFAFYCMMKVKEISSVETKLFLNG